MSKMLQPSSSGHRGTTPVTSTLTTQRIRVLAGWGAIMCGLGLAILIGNFAAALASDGWRDMFMFGGLQKDGGVPIPVSDDARRKFVWIMALPTLVQSFAMWTGLQLFCGYRRGEIFTSSAARLLTRIGWAIFAMAPMGILLKFPLSQILTTAPGMSVSFSVTDLDFSSIAFGLMGILIGKVLAEAVRLAQENEMFI
jgi:Protein of unknown function (DUF2975)